METVTNTIKVLDFSLEEDIVYDQNEHPYSDVKVLPMKGDWMTYKIYHDKLEKFFNESSWFSWDLPSEYCDKFTAFLYEGPMDLLIKDYLNIEIVE